MFTFYQAYCLRYWYYTAAHAGKTVWGLIATVIFAAFFFPWALYYKLRGKRPPDLELMSY